MPQSYASEEWVMVDYPCRRQISRYCEQYYKTSGRKFNRIKNRYFHTNIDANYELVFV